VNIPQIRPAAIICTRCGGTADGPAADQHAAHGPGCTALADYETAMAGARRAEGDATWAMAVTAAQQGTGTVAAAAFVPGGPPVGDLQAAYERLQDRTRTTPLHAA
jgi:hypothetical protein